MSRASTTARPLSLTEELEKLEQQITLTLQEIDHNFSRAHRIVTGSILPVVEKYADHSKAVWEGSKFWKQFFEASANVSLSGVEERDGEEEELSYAQSHENQSSYAASTQGGDETLRSDGGHESYDGPDDSLMDNSISGSTPRVHRSKPATEAQPKFAEFSSPYEELKNELKGGARDADEDEEEEESELPPTTPGAARRIPNMSMTPTSSPFDPTSYLPSATGGRAGGDVLLHRVLDKNYHIKATPHTSRKEDKLQKAKTPIMKPSWRDNDSPMSSPTAPAPQLRSEIFSSPSRQPYRPAPRTPGVSVQTPAKGKGKDIFAKPNAKKDEISWESDSDEDAEGMYNQMGMSPPKTIQFSFAPNRLLQTPAQEASKRIVDDILTTAGAFDDSDGLDSPSMVAMKDDLDFTF